VAVLEPEVVCAIQDLSEETTRREAANGRLSALCMVAASIVDAVLGAGSLSADPLEHLGQVPERLRAQQREIISTGIFFGVRQALGVARSHLPRVDFTCFTRGFTGSLPSEQRRETVEGMFEVARPIAKSVQVSVVLCRSEEQRRASVKGEVPTSVEGAPQQPQQPPQE
jgi:hypothetical protein